MCTSESTVLDGSAEARTRGSLDGIWMRGIGRVDVTSGASGVDVRCHVMSSVVSSAVARRSSRLFFRMSRLNDHSFRI
jgi:hypothetical protein